MDEELEERLERFGKTPGKLIGDAKKKWSGIQKKVIVLDSLTREEAAIFKEDPVLMGYMLDIAEIEVKIQEHIQKHLMIYRSTNGSQPSFLKEGAALKKPVFKKEVGK